MIKFIVAGLWLVAATVGAAIFSFQMASSKSETAATEAEAPLLGGLDYVKTEVMSIPVIKRGGVVGYFLTRLVYTVEPAKLKSLTVPASTLFSDELYTYLYSNPNINFTEVSTLDIDAFRTGVKDAINKRLGDTVLHDVMVDQIDFLTKEEIRNNTISRRVASDNAKAAGIRRMGESSEEPAKPAGH